MRTVIYLANRQIQVLVGKRGKHIQVDRYLSGEVPEGTVINGMVMDRAPFVEFLRDFWKRNELDTKNVILVSSSTKFVGQTIQMPPMSSGKALGFIRREFTHIDKNETKLYGFLRLKGASGKIQRVYAESVSPELIRAYIEIFRDAGVTLGAICSGESCIIRLTEQTLGREADTFMIQIVDSMTLSTVLFSAGAFTYYNSVRCFHEPGTEEYAEDIGRSVSQIRQFMQANQMEGKLKRLILAGIEPEALGLYQRVISAMGIDIDVELFSAPEHVSGQEQAHMQQFLFAASGLTDWGKNSNYVWIARHRKEKSRLQVGRNGLLIGATAAVMAAGWVFSALYAEQQRTALVQAQEENKRLLLLTADYEAGLEENGRLLEQYRQMALISENLSTYPWLTGEIKDSLEQCAEDYAMSISINSCSADTGIVSMTVTMENGDVTKVNQFVRALGQQPGFYDVSYSGYSYQGEGTYLVNVTVTLGEPEGEEAAN